MFVLNEHTCTDTVKKQKLIKIVWTKSKSWKANTWSNKGWQDTVMRRVSTSTCREYSSSIPLLSSVPPYKTCWMTRRLNMKGGRTKGIRYHHGTLVSGVGSCMNSCLKATIFSDSCIELLKVADVGSSNEDCWLWNIRIRLEPIILTSYTQTSSLLIVLLNQ
jgi:hypothetical protein